MVAIEANEKKRPMVLAAGVFDLLHMGHVKFLEEAKRAGGQNAELVVIVARDKTAKERKGEKPVMSENQRRALVEALSVVDEAILGYEEPNIGKVIEKIQPNVVALGHDQKNVGEKVRKAIAGKGLGTRVITIGQFSDEELNSTTAIKKKIIRLYRRKP